MSSTQLVQLALQLESSTQVKVRGSAGQEGCSKMEEARLEHCTGVELQLGCCRGVELEMSLQEQTGVCGSLPRLALQLDQRSRH